MATGIIIPSARGGNVWSHGEDPTGDPKKVQVDSNGNAIVVPAAGAVLLGFESVYLERTVNYSSPGGYVALSYSAVPAGKIRILNNVVFYDATSAISWSRAQVVHGGAGYAFEFVNAPVAGEVGRWTGEIVVAATDYIQVNFNGTTAGDLLNVYLYGRELTIP